MAQVLAGLAIDVEAAVALVFRLARAFDTPGDPLSHAWRRLMTPVVKYWVCKTAPPFVAEAMECLGGNGYVEAGPLARIYREAPVNSIWEGSGNIMALDMVRVLRREPALVRSLLDDQSVAIGSSALKGQRDRVGALLRDEAHIEANARAICEGLAVFAAGALLERDAPPEVAQGFIAMRCSGQPPGTYGATRISEVRAIIGRALPVA
jgi:putative acyl-CoA dehydrogenase